MIRVWPSLGSIGLGVLLLSQVQVVQGATLLPVPSGKMSAPSNLLDWVGTFYSSFDFNILGEQDTYRIGSEWGKKGVTTQGLQNETPAFQRAAFATARVPGATAFYLGKFNQHLVMASNHHVFPAAKSCLGASVVFPLLNVSAKCFAFYGSWPEIDLSLFAIQLQNPADETKLHEVAGNFEFHTDLFVGEPLITVGFGIAGNPGRKLMGNQDSDCKVFSKKGDYHLMGDPDALNPGTYKAWSFSNGCDVSHGDSGSAMVDRQTGQVVGIIWTGKVPKSKSIQDSAYLEHLIHSESSEIWTELSYGVPAVKMGEVLGEAVLDPKMAEDTRNTIRALLNI